MDDFQTKSGEARISGDLTLYYRESGKGLPHQRGPALSQRAFLKRKPYIRRP